MNESLNNNYNNQMRNRAIDFLRGCAVIMVVLGHLIQLNDSNYDGNIVFRFIYSLHMPLFFFISGFVTIANKETYNIWWLLKKCNRIFIPYLAWSFIWYILRGTYKDISISEYLLIIFYNPDRCAPWFLMALFQIMIIVYLLAVINSFIFKRYDNRELKKWMLVIFGIMVIPFFIFASQYIDFINNMDSVRYLSYFFVGGIIALTEPILQKNKWPSYICGLLSIIIYMTLFPFWNRNMSVYELKQISFINCINNSDKYIYIFLLIFNNIVSLSIIIFLYCFVSLMYKYVQLIWIERIGRNSLAIYAMHLFFIGSMLNSMYYINIILFAFGSIVSSIFTATLIRKNTVLKKILLGE